MAAFPEADEPERGEPAFGKQIELPVGNVLKTMDRITILSRQLVEPDIGAFGDHDHFGHPRGVVRVSGRSVAEVTITRNVRFFLIHGAACRSRSFMGQVFKEKVAVFIFDQHDRIIKKFPPR